MTLACRSEGVIFLRTRYGSFLEEGSVVLEESSVVLAERRPFSGGRGGLPLRIHFHPTQCVKMSSPRLTDVLWELPTLLS